MGTPGRFRVQGRPPRFDRPLHVIPAPAHDSRDGGPAVPDAATRPDREGDRGRPWLAIGTAKEKVETTCKPILTDRGKSFDKGWDLMRLFKEARDVLRLAPDDIPDTAKASDTIKRLLSNLATVVQGLAELRNPYGTGHEPDGRAKGLHERHDRLAEGAASTLALFLLETHRERRS